MYIYSTSYDFHNIDFISHLSKRFVKCVNIYMCVYIYVYTLHVTKETM